MTSRAAAFFDLDGTLITVNSGRLWLEHEHREGNVDRATLFKGFAYLAGYHLGVVDLARVFDDAAAAIRGVSEATLRERTSAWYDAEVARHEAAGAAQVIARHRDEGHMLVLLTTASSYEAEHAAARFGIDRAIGTRFESHEGSLTGKVVPPVPFGRGKVKLAERFAQEHGVDLARSFFYSDSVTDAPLLARVGNPRVVNPDPRLRRLARRNGWPVLDLRVARAVS